VLILPLRKCVAVCGQYSRSDREAELT